MKTRFMMFRSSKRPSAEKRMIIGIDKIDDADVVCYV